MSLCLTLNDDKADEEKDRDDDPVKRTLNNINNINKFLFSQRVTISRWASIKQIGGRNKELGNGLLRARDIVDLQF